MKDYIFNIDEIIGSQKSIGLCKELWIRIFGKKRIGYDVIPNVMKTIVVMHEYKGVLYMLTPIKYIEWNQ